jgi:hypothetical protein
MSFFRSICSRRVLTMLLTLALAAPAAGTTTLVLGSPHVIKKAACSGQAEDAAKRKQQAREKGNTDPVENDSAGCGAEGDLSGFVNAANAVVNPAVIAMIAIAPIACLVGAGSLFFGSRRGLMIIGSALGTLVFIISVKGIVA